MASIMLIDLRSCAMGRAVLAIDTAPLAMGCVGASTRPVSY
jgi:hypothetical protein